MKKRLIIIPILIAAVTATTFAVLHFAGKGNDSKNVSGSLKDDANGSGGTDNTTGNTGS